MVDWLTAPWTEPVLQRAFLEVALIGLVGGLLGCWLVLYELSYSAESLAHALFPGLVAAALLGLPLLVGGAAGVLIAALGVALAGRAPEIGRDTAVAVVVTTLFGAGALLALAPSSPPGLGALLFGDVLGVDDVDLALASGLAAVLLVALALLHERLLAVGFDRGAARGLGVSPLVVDAGLLVLLGAAIVVAVQGLGNLLVVAVLIGPAATARLVAHRMRSMMAVSTAVAVLAGAAGLYLSYYAGTAAGASIAAVLVVCFLTARAAYHAA
jgi:ABC-type Mn2+/Zn2+ transport system permease subunit